jgi:metallo-beta-lactamase class B
MKTPSAIAVALFVSAVPAQAQTVSDLLAQMKTTWNAPSEPFKIIDNVYYVGTAGLSSFLVTSPGGHVLIDTGLPEANPLIKENITKLGFKVSDIKYLLNTHAHLDHTGGLAELKKETGAQMVASAGDKPLLEGGYYPGAEEEEVLKFPPVKVDRVVGEGDKITIPDTIGKGRAKRDLTLVAHMTPGHSPGCTTWTTVAREKKWNHTAVFFCSISPAVNKLVDPYPGRVDDYKKTFATAKGIIADVFLPPLPELFKLEEKRPLIGQFGVNPFVKAGEFHAYVREAEKPYLEEVPPKPKKSKWRSKAAAETNK